MNRKTKILIVRFSSIGDIILTTPIIRCIKLQSKNVDLHYLTKLKYKDILSQNPYIDKCQYFDNNFLRFLKILKEEKYDLIIDLHNSLRSKMVRLALATKNFVYNKENFKKFMLLNLGLNLSKLHTVDRYFLALKDLQIKNDNKGLDVFIDDNYNVSFNTSQKYISWCIGGSYENKKLSDKQILYVCDKLNFPIVFLGGSQESDLAEKIISKSSNNQLYNFCGKIDFSESSYLVKKSSLLLTNDTSILHVGSALKLPMISFWGCTKPELGFRSYLNPKSYDICSENRRPCSKHGNKCKVSDNGCVKTINPEIIYNKVNRVLIK